MSKATLKKRIKELAYEGSWNKGGEETFLKHALLLVECGYAEEVIIEWLTSLYWAVASEFGA